VGASSASAVEAVEARALAAEEGVASASAAYSLRTSSFSSVESLRMIILSSSGGPWTSRLRSSQSFLMNSSSYKVSGMRHYSSEDEERSKIGAFLEEPPPCSNTGERGRREEIFDGDPNGGGDPEGARGGVGALLDNGLSSLEGERACLVPLLFSIVCKWRARKINPKQERKNKCEMVINARRKEYL
jgi:hypothetical protein